MTVKDIMTDVARIVESDGLASAIDAGTESGNAEYAKKSALILKCYNAVLRTVGFDYEPLVKKMAVSGGRADYSDLPYVPLKVLAAYAADGTERPFTERASFVTFPADAAFIEAKCVAKDAAKSTAFEYENSRTGKFAFIYGTCAEYCLINGRYDEAANFDSRFRVEAERSTAGKSRRIKARRDWGL